MSDLVRQGFLRTSLRAPMTVVDPLAYVIDRLRGMEPEVGRAASIADDLASVAKQIQAHNDPPDHSRDPRRDPSSVGHPDGRHLR